MSNRKQRRKNTYLKRTQEKKEKIIQKLQEVKPFEKLSNLTLWMYYGFKSMKGVAWKRSVQLFKASMFTKTVKKIEAYKIGKNRRKNYTRFTIMERGKKRDISAPHIEDRQPDKLITKEIITPVYRSHSIYDNGASTVGKGFHFAISRLKKMLSEHYKKYGTEGGVLLLDIKGYFPNAQHSQIKKSHEVFFPDEKVKEVLWSYVEPQFKEPDFLRDKRGNKIKDKNGDYIIIKDENPHVGMPLGLEPSQQEMINYPVFFDNWLTGQKHLRVQHYMDDYVVDIPPNVSVYYLLKEITEKAKENGMTLSPTKTRYVPLTKSFRYCKIWFKIGENGKIITKGSKKSYQNSKRRLDMFKREIEAGTHSYEDLRSFAQSSFNYYDDYMDGKRKWKLVKLFREYFGFDYKDTYMYYWKQKEIEAPEIVSVIKEWQSKILKQKKILESGYKYKCVEAYTGFNIFNDLVVIKEGDELISRQGILVCKNKPICLVNSAIAHAHFFYNEDKHAIRRGHLIEKIKEQVKHLQEGEVLNGKWQSFLEDKKAKNYGKLIERSENPYLDETWIWSDSFYYADIKDLEHLEKKTKKKKQYIPQDVFDEMRKEQEEKSLPKREKKKKKRKKKYKQWRK